MVGADRQFGVGRHVAAAAATLGVVDAVEGHAGGGRVGRWAVGRLGLRDIPGCGQVLGSPPQGLHFSLRHNALVFHQIDLAALPAIVLIVGIIDAGRNGADVDGGRLDNDGIRN